MEAKTGLFSYCLAEISMDFEKGGVGRGVGPMIFVQVMISEKRG